MSAMFDNLNFSLDMSQSDLDGYLMNRESRLEQPVETPAERVAPTVVASRKPTFLQSVTAMFRRQAQQAASGL